MPGEVRIYFEGDASLRPGFDAFFRQIKEQARKAQWTVSLVATGGTPDRDFAIANRKHPSAWNILLRDSEGPFNSGGKEDSTFWMVQTMEAWFHADKDAMGRYYGQGFRRDALSRNPRVEEIPKQDLIDGLKDATKDTRKGRYHKTRHAPKLLELIAPDLVRKAAPHCGKLFTAVLNRLTSDA